MNASLHAPVMLDEVLAAAAGRRRAVDATLGDGGHALALRQRGMQVLGIDRDPSAIRRAQSRLGDDGISYLQAIYSAPEALAAMREFSPDFLLADLGVSGPQLDEDARGFSFRTGAPLDMRMGSGDVTAAEFLNSESEQEIARILRDYGDERRARRLAAEIVRRRARAPFATSDDLVNAIRAVLGRTSGPPEFARIFQAVRIAVNEELEGLDRAMPAFLDALEPDGVLAVISYHSGEDRRVKQAYRTWERGCTCPPKYPVCTCGNVPRGHASPRRGVTPSEQELAVNPRARSARLRIFRKGNGD